MTKAEWDAMDYEKRRTLVAENVMGWKLEWVREPFGEGSYNWVDMNNVGQFAPDDFFPTTDRNACALVLEEIKERGLQQDHGRLISQQVGGQSFAVAIVLGNVKIGDMWGMIWGLINSDPDTICYCAVKAVTDGS